VNGRIEPDELRIIAVDWSGAVSGAEKRIWLAEVTGGALRRLECGRSREEVGQHIVDLAGGRRPIVAGLDFAFSMPAWFVRETGAGSAAQLWSIAAREGERWLAACEPPFWGRPGKRRPASAAPQFRRGEAACARAFGMTPKSVFQVGGSGAVGTGSLRGMPVLATLHDAGIAVWPFCTPARTTVLEIYPRIFTGRVVKSRVEARAAHLAREFPALPGSMRDAAIASEDAFDAAVSAMRMWEHRGELARLRRARDAETLLEGAIWTPCEAVR
jgi:hypothetical protein